MGGTNHNPRRCARAFKDALAHGWHFTEHTIENEENAYVVIHHPKLRNTWIRVSYKHDHGQFKKLWGRTCSPIPNECDRCHKLRIPYRELISCLGNVDRPGKLDEKDPEYPGDQLALCNDCYHGEQRALIEWGWSDLFGEPGCVGVTGEIDLVPGVLPGLSL